VRKKRFYVTMHDRWSVTMIIINHGDVVLSVFFVLDNA
jgi:hypothetical protein